MKLNKLIRKAASFLTVFAMTCGIMMTYSPSVSGEETIEDIKNQIEQIKQQNKQRRDEINRLDGDISENKEALDEVSALLGEQKQLMDYYNNLVYYKNIDISEKEAEIADKEESIQKKDADIAAATDNIAKLEEQNKENLEKFAQIIRTMYTTSSGDMFGVMAGSTDFYSLMVNSEIIGNITEKNQEFMNQLQQDINKLASDKKQLETDKKNLLSDKQQLEEDRAVLLEEQAELQSLADESTAAAQQYENDYNNYQSAIDNLENEKDNLDYLISVSEADIEAYEEQIKQIIISQSQPEKELQQGEWIWPVPGRSYISCYFGWDGDFGRWHKGVDVGDAGIYGDSILATKAGTVIVAESSYIPGYSYGMYVVVDHGGGYTSTYAHMSGVNVYVGQEVAQGDVLGYVGNTGWSTGAHLHFEIRINGEPQDPFGFVTIA